MESALRHQIITLEDCGPVSVFVQGDERKLKDGVVFLTVHDVGATYQNWVTFLKDESMADIRARSVFLHVVIPGQEPGAKDLPKDFSFPTMHQLGIGLVTILDQLRIASVVGLGDGAGANIITRFAMMHPTRVHGIVTVNNTATESLGRFTDRLKARLSALKKDQKDGLNERNVASFAEAYKRRKEFMTELNNRIKCDVLLITGMKSKYVGDTEAIHREMKPGLCSIIKVEDVSEPLAESMEKVAEAVLLFCQGMGLLPTLQRRMSRQDSRGNSTRDENRKSSTMDELDIPQPRRIIETIETPALARAALSF